MHDGIDITSITQVLAEYADPVLNQILREAKTTWLIWTVVCVLTGLATSGYLSDYCKKVKRGAPDSFAGGFIAPLLGIGALIGSVYSVTRLLSVIYTPQAYLIKILTGVGN